MERTWGGQREIISPGAKKQWSIYTNGVPHLDAECYVNVFG